MNPWIGLFVVGVALVLIGVLLALVSYGPTGTISPLSWVVTMAGGVCAGIALGKVDET